MSSFEDLYYVAESKYARSCEAVYETSKELAALTKVEGRIPENIDEIVILSSKLQRLVEAKSFYFEKLGKASEEMEQAEE